jgi:hypothetical protein
MNRRIGTTALLAALIALVPAACASNQDVTRQPSTTSPSPSISSPSPAVSISTPTASMSLVSPQPTTAPSATPVARPSPLPVRTPPAQPVTEGRRGATDLRALGFCDPASPATPAMALSWQPSGAGEQLVAIATLPDGFDTGRYTVSGDLPAQLQGYAVSPVEPGGLYYWRVLTRTATGWSASEVATFIGTTCVVDAS